MSNTPQIRFAGFTDAWEQRKVGVFYDFKNGLNKGKAFFGHGTPIVNFTDVFHNRSLYCKDLCGRVSLSIEEINNFNVHKGDLFFTRTSETIEEIGYSSVMMDEPESTVFSGFVLRGRAVDDDPLENIFKSYVFFTDTFRKEMIMKSSMTTRALTSGTAIKKMLFYYPSDKTEQKRIGSLLEHLDHLITLHQRKCGALQKFKKSMLQKMFPQNGESVPEIRFAGFTDAWEQRKLDTLVEFYSGLTYKPEDVTENGTLVLRSSNVKNAEIVLTDNVYVDESVVNSENVKKDDIIVVVRNGSKALIGKHAKIRHSMPNTVIGAFMTGIRSDSPDFINALLSTDTFDKEIKMNMGATINQITGYMFANMEFMTPSFQERQAVGSFFSRLDDLITLHQRKLETLQKMKKSLLQKMFV